MDALRIFIGWERRQAEAAEVLAFSLRKHASIPLDIRELRLGELDLPRPHDPLQSTEFTYTRFLVPQLCGYAGRALYMDCDMLCLADVKELAGIDMQGLALRVVQHDHRPTARTKMDGRPQSAYPRKNWSSLMWMDCARLTLWNRRSVAERTGAALHRFVGIPDDQIGDLPASWNQLDTADERTRILHYTSGGPWFDECRDHAFGRLWLETRDEMRRARC